VGISVKGGYSNARPRNWWFAILPGLVVGLSIFSISHPSPIVSRGEHPYLHNYIEGLECCSECSMVSVNYIVSWP
jgi:hypothetical protein